MPVSGAFATTSLATTSLATKSLPQTDWCSDSRYGEWSACCDPARGNYRPGWCWDDSGRNEGNWRDASYDPNWNNWSNWNDGWRDNGWRDGGWNNGGWNDDWHDGGHGYDGNWHDSGYRNNWNH
ncbi:hypothetical protein ACQEVM_09720 [Streptomyces sp. CA-243310]|uniref:hypothetical protein n=1 Tax=Streptomyces sp. CA-243310 TaxID=3240056 RepID=UPI003D8D956C